MSGKNPEALRTTLAAADDCIHSAVYQTLPHEGTPGLEHPGDLYSALGNLRLMHAHEGQLLGQVQDWLAAEYAAGRVAHDSGLDAGTAVMDVSTALLQAAASVALLEKALSNAHTASSGLKAARNPSRPAQT